MTNSEIAELLACQAETDELIPEHRRRAFSKAARAALSWSESVQQLAREGRSLRVNLRGVGPYIEAVLLHWLESEPEVPEPPAIRHGFTSRAEVVEAVSQDRFRDIFLKGDLHVHSDWSDGKNSLAELAEAAELRGYSYLAVTDHGAKLPVARGLPLAKQQHQGREIRELNEELRLRGARVRLLRSSELNFNKKGEVDYDEETLKSLDFAIAAYHNGLRTTEDQTERYLAAMENPYVDVHAHPVCRVYNQRLGLKADWNRVFGRAAELGKAVEVDGIPDRQDLPATLLAEAKRHDLYISLGSDSHSLSHLEYIDFSVAAVVKAGIRRDRILNLMTYGELLDWRENRLENHLSLLGEARPTNQKKRSKALGS